MTPVESPADTTADTTGATTDGTGDGDGDGDGTETCPGCGIVLAVVPGRTPSRAGASASCSALFEVTVGGLRDEAAADVQTAALLQLATDVHAAQHPGPGRPAEAAARLCRWVAGGLDPLRTPEFTERPAGVAPRPLSRPVRWTTTIADVAADLDVVDLPSLVRSWAEAVWTDWAPALDAPRTDGGAHTGTG